MSRQPWVGDSLVAIFGAAVHELGLALVALGDRINPPIVRPPAPPPVVVPDTIPDALLVEQR